MNEDSERVFYLVPLHQKGNGVTLLSLPSDLPEVSGSQRADSVGYGIFGFLRHEMNRGTPRMLSFPAIHGFGENAQEIALTLRSDYPSTRNANRFVFDNADGRFSQISFIARKFPSNFKLIGNALRFASYNLWALIPENREQLEVLWRESGFYLMGHGK